MKRKLFLLFSSAWLFSNSLVAQSNNYWKQVKADGNYEASKTQKNFPVTGSNLLFELNQESIKKSLFTAVERKSTNNSKGIIIEIPNTKGQIEQFEVFEASNFDKELQAKYPEIRSYVGLGITDKKALLRLSYSPYSVQTMVMRGGSETEFIEPYSEDKKVYVAFTSSRNKGKMPFTCSTQDKIIAEEALKVINTAKSSAKKLRTFRLALSCTAEYANYFGATSSANVALVNAAYNATLTRVNGVFEKDLAIHLDLVATNDNAIFYNAATDPYSNSDTGTNGAWNGELQSTLTSVIGEANYDIGHLFGGDGGGGNAGCIGCVCVDGQKGSAYTSPGDGKPEGDTFDIDYVAHELGHQLGGNHTFTHTTENSPVNYEPGSGSTIMAYAGITNFDVQKNSNDYFHAGSIAQIQTNLDSKTCGTSLDITYTAPTLTLPTNMTIPVNTPFSLTASATGGSGALTYCWEQYDEATLASQLCSVSNVNPAGDQDCVPTSTKTTGPIFRSYPPTTSGTRYFPRLETLTTGTTTTQGLEIPVEILSTVARNYNFRLTVRDLIGPVNRNPTTGVGQTTFGDMTVTVDATKGPFNVTSQSSDNITWNKNTTETITWDVNNTNTMAGASNVDILLSTDGGLTYSTVLASNTPNDGSHAITVPDVLAPYCHVMVKPTGANFFDINQKSFAIGYTVLTEVICKDYTRNFTTPASIATSWGAFNLPAPPGVPDSYTITDANVKVQSTAARTNQVSFGLVMPGSGTVDYVLFDGPSSGCGNNKANLNAVFDDEGANFDCNATNTGASYKPVTPLTGVDGMNSFGQWRLAAKSTVAGNTLSSITLTLCETKTTITLSNEDNAEFESFKLFPNPNKGQFTLSFDSKSSDNVGVSVYDISGREIFKKVFKNQGLFNQEINLNNTQSGVYLVSISDGTRKTVKRIIIE